MKLFSLSLCSTWILLKKFVFLVFQLFCQVLYRLFGSVYLIYFLFIKISTLNNLFFYLFNYQNISFFDFNLSRLILSLSHHFSFLQKSSFPRLSFQLTLRFFQKLFYFILIILLNLLLNVSFHLFSFFYHICVCKICPLLRYLYCFLLNLHLSFY